MHPANKEPTNYLDQPALAALAAGLKASRAGGTVGASTKCVGDCQNYGPFLCLLNPRCHITLY